MQLDLKPEPRMTPEKNLKDPSTAMSEPPVIEQMEKVFSNTGTSLFNGYIEEEYERQWSSTTRADTVEKMRRGDGTVQGLLQAIKAPILATKWLIRSASDDPKQEEIRQFVEDCLFNMKRTWKDFLREALGYLDFGYYPFELIWEKREGKVVLADLAPRIPRSIQKWQLSDGSFGLVQLLNNDLNETRHAEIPAWKLLIFTNNKEGDDITGQSVLRSPWKHYYYKDNLYKIQAIAAERFGVGVPVMKIGAAASSGDKDYAENLLRNLRSNQKSYMVLPASDWTLEIISPNGNPQGQAIESAIDHHTKQMLMATLASFLTLGDNGVGSNALSEDRSSFFLKVVENITTYVREQMGQQVIQRMVDVNFGKQKQYPYIACGVIGDLDLKAMSETIVALANAGLVVKDAKFTQFIHDTFGYPELSKEKMEMMAEKEIEKDLERYEKGESSTEEVTPVDKVEDKTKPPVMVPEKAEGTGEEE